MLVIIYRIAPLTIYQSPLTIVKILIKLIVLAAIVYFGWNFFTSKNNPEPLINLTLPTDGQTDRMDNFSIKIRNEEKEELKQYLGKIKYFLYRKATEHNPSGDVLPDNIDDQVIGEMKEKIN